MSGDLWGGSEAQMELQLAALMRAGLEILVVFFNSAETSARFEKCGIPICCLEEQRGLRGLIRDAAERSAVFDPDLIVSHGYKEAAVGAILSRRTKRPLITTFHGAPEIFSGFAAIRSRLYSLIHTLTAKLEAKRVITVSDALGEELGFKNLKKRRTIRNVVQIKDHLSPAALTKPAIAVVGRLVKVKRVELALAAFAELIGRGFEASLYVAGDGPERGELERLAARLGIQSRVHFLGFRPDAQEIIAGSDVLLITSVREGIPSVLLEALALRRQIVSVGLPGIREVAQRISGKQIHFSADTPSELAEALKKALAEEAQSSCDLSEFTPDTAAAKHIEIYREVV